MTQIVPINTAISSCQPSVKNKSLYFISPMKQGIKKSTNSAKIMSEPVLIQFNFKIPLNKQSSTSIKPITAAEIGRLKAFLITPPIAKKTSSKRICKKTMPIKLNFAEKFSLENKWYECDIICGLLRTDVLFYYALLC